MKLKWINLNFDSILLHREENVRNFNERRVLKVKKEIGNEKVERR